MVMSDIIQLEDIDPTGIEKHPADSSVKLHGPPGTGKTTQSAARVGRLLRDHDYSLGNVAWCTYRKALAFDTLQRFVDWDLLPEHELRKPHQGQTRHISTIHAVANRTVGDLPNPVMPGHKIDFCKRMDLRFLAEKPWDDTPGQTLFRVFEWLKNNCYNPAVEADVRECPFTDDLRQEWNGSVPAAWNKWEDYKAQKNVIDFHEMLQAPIDEGTIPTSDILVIDEYHDATPLMARLCEHWVDHADIVIVAGDPNQVVNAFDGAHPRFFRELELPKVLLDVTYRVPEEHWNAATTLLSKAHDAPPVRRKGHGQIVEYASQPFAYSDDGGWDTPAPGSPGGPADIVNKHGDDTLFLTRMQMQADGVGYALERAGILYNSQADLYGWNTENGETRHALFNGLQKIRGFQPGHFDAGTSGLFQYDDPPRNPDATVLSSAEASELLTYTHAKYLSETRSEVNRICDDIEDSERTVTLTEFAGYVDNGFWSKHSAGAASVNRLNKGNLKKRDRMALQEALKRHTGPVDLEEIDTAVLTIHASKGQEAEDVVVYDGVSRRIRREMQKSPTIADNEWRTWFVALTRASKRLHIMRNAFQWTSPIIPKGIRSHVGEVASD